jgi:hypothetical protein
MDGAAFDIDRAAVVDRIAKQIENPAEGFLADGDGDGPAGIDDIHAAAQAVGGAEGDRADAAAAEVLLHFAGEMDGHAVDLGIDFDGVIDGRELFFGELGVECGADDLADFSGRGHCVSPSCFRVGDCFN